MTVSEMIDSFLVEYGMVLAIPAPSFTDAEIIKYLNNAQYKITDQLYANKNWILIDNLLSTQTYSAPFTTKSQFESGITLSLTTGPSRYLYYINSYTSITRSSFPEIASAMVVKNENIAKSEAAPFIVDGLKSPIFRYPKAYEDGTDLIILIDAYTTVGSSIYVEYLSRPKELIATVVDATNETTTCELKDSLHDEVVSRAVELVQIDTDPKRAEAKISLTKTL